MSTAAAYNGLFSSHMIPSSCGTINNNLSPEDLTLNSRVSGSLERNNNNSAFDRKRNKFEKADRSHHHRTISVNSDEEKDKDSGNLSEENENTTINGPDCSNSNSNCSSTTNNNNLTLISENVGIVKSSSSGKQLPGPGNVAPSAFMAAQHLHNAFHPSFHWSHHQQLHNVAMMLESPPTTPGLHVGGKLLHPNRFSSTPPASDSPHRDNSGMKIFADVNLLLFTYSMYVLCMG